MRSVVGAVAFMLCVPARATAQSPAPNGEAVYRQHCARCHEGTMPRMPSREALGAVTPEHIDTALSSFSMRREGASLSPAERRAVAEFLTGRPAGSYRAPLDAIAKSAFCGPGASSSRDLLEGASWNGWGGDLRNTRSQSAEGAGLAAGDVPRLKLKWAFGIPGVSASGSQVTIVGSRLFVAAQPAAVSVIPGAVFSGSLDGHLRAYASDTGRVILDLDTAREFETVNGIPARGGSLNGPGATVAGGMLFVSSGYGSLGFMPGNVVLAFSVDGK